MCFVSKGSKSNILLKSVNKHYLNEVNYIVYLIMFRVLSATDQWNKHKSHFLGQRASWAVWCTRVAHLTRNR